MKTTQTPRDLRLGDRLELRFSTSRDFDGLWIGTIESDAEAILRRVEEALAMIRLHDPRRYDRLRRDVSRIWVRLLPGDQASFNAAAGACQLDSRYVRDPTATTHDLATSIVHEAAHARIDRRVSYREGLRHRIEAACRRQEQIFSRRLPGGTEVQQEIDAWLAAPPSKELWSDSAFEQRFVDGSLNALRHLGVPERILAVILGVRALMVAFREAARGLTRRWSGPAADRRIIEKAAGTAGRSTPRR